MKTPAEMLKGLQLEGENRRWRVIDEINKDGEGSGGHFSSSYLVMDQNGSKAFLKAMDYAKAFEAEDPPRELELLTATFNFERDLLALCADRNLDRVVRVIDQGKVEVQGAARTPVKLVNFLVFELAESDVSCQVDKLGRFNTAVCLRTIHHVAVGLQQLHGSGITHQDLRPSNVLQFQDMITKLADLGRAGSVRHSAPHDQFPIPGCLRYAPPELLYEMRPGDTEVHQWRRAGDMFLLGSMLFFLIEGQMLMPSIQAQLDPEHSPESWNGSYDDILPYLRKAFAEVVQQFEEHCDEEVQSRLVSALKQLCEPDPRLRGHPRNLSGGSNQYSLERYISLFNLLAAKAEWRVKH